MSSLLLLTQDVQAVDRIQQLAVERNIRVRAVATPGAAREWLAMQSFSLLLVDSRYGDPTPIEILSLGWQHNPLLVGGIFNLYEKVPDEWTARLVGARVWSGPDALAGIKRCFDTLPESFSIAERSYYAVMVVDDLDAPRDIICAYIEALGYPHVEGVADAASCLAELRKNPYEYFCVITDIQMPKMNGLELVKAIRNDTLIDWLPIVLLTSISTAENLVEGLKYGATGFLTKPPRKPQLRAELEKAKRLVVQRQTPRLCLPDEAQFLENALLKRSKL